MPQKDVRVIGKDQLSEFIEAQSFVPKHYSPNRQDLKEIEQSSARFLQDLIDGNIRLDSDALKLWPVYSQILKHSGYQSIQSKLEKADNTCRVAVISQVKKEKRWESICANNFAILQKKKEIDKLTSEDLLMIVNALDNEKSYNTTKTKDKLRSIIQNRIDQVLRGEREADDDFGRLVGRSGNNLQKQRYDAKKTKMAPAIEETAIVKPIIITPRKEGKTEISARAKELSANNFGILYKNKETIDKLSSDDLLMMAEMLDNEKGYKTAKQKDKLRSIIQQRIEQTLSGKREEDEKFAELVAKRGLPQQRRQYDNKKAPGAIIEFVDDAEYVEKKDEKREENKDEEKTEKKASKTSWFKNAWQKTKRWAVVAGIAILGVVGINKCASSATDDGTKADTTAPKTETVTPKQTSPVMTVEDVKETKAETKVEEEPKAEVQAQVTTQQDTKTADFSEEQANYEQKYKDHVQSFLAVHNVDGKTLIDKINDLAEQGKIQFEEGTNAEWYAHAFTVYSKVAPNSKENKMIKALMAGEDVNPQTINQLVVQAKRDGSGVKGHGRYSAYNHASKQKQANYRKTLKDVRTARMAMERAQHAR